jgi:protein ImuB
MRMNEVSPSRAKGPRILSLFLPRLPTDRLIRPKRRRAASGGPPDAPLAVVAKIKNALRVVALDRTAERRGVRLGQTLADARGAVPDLAVTEADDAADRALLEAIADWCDRYTPLIALDPPLGLFLDISGCAHLFAREGGDGEGALLADLLFRLTAQGFAARGAVASTAGAAWALARYGRDEAMPPGAEAEAIADLPVAALRISDEQEDLLDRLGLKRIGQLIGKPRAPLAARFGIDLVRRLDQALGAEDEALSPRRPAPMLSAERRFLDPVADEASLLVTVRSLAGALEPALERRGLGARLLEAACFRVDGHVARAGIGTASPIRAAEEVAVLFTERLEALGADWDAGFGFDMVRLSVLETEPLAETQIGLSGEEAGGGDFHRLVDRLGARLGAARVTRFVAVDTHIPERAARAEPLASENPSPVPGEGGPRRQARVGRGETAVLPASPPPPLAQAQGAPSPAPAMRSASLRGGRREGGGSPHPSRSEISEAPPGRPLRLFARPEPVEAIAEVPDGPPIRFRWRRVMHEVARAEGPERIAPEWWRPEDAERLTRDYFRVEDSEGRRYWLFREGLYGREAIHPVWYVHGLFA